MHNEDIRPDYAAPRLREDVRGYQAGDCGVGGVYSLMINIDQYIVKRNPHIYDAFTDDATKARVIERFGDSSQLLDIKPCVYGVVSK